MSAPATVAARRPPAPSGHGRRLVDLVYHRLRLRNPWNYKAPFLVALPYFMIAVGRVAWDRALLGILAALCTIAGIAGLAYFLNDLGDAAKDRAAGRDNAVGRMTRTQQAVLLALFLAAALGPWLYLPVTRLTAGLLAAELGLFVVYCFPPFRLKERGVLGLLTDAIYAHALPAVLAVLTFSYMAREPYADLWVFVAVLAAWQLALGVRNIVLHQLQDHANDVRAGSRTLAVALGPERVEGLLARWLVPLEVVSFAAFAIVVSRSMFLFAPAYGAFFLLTLGRIRLLALPRPTTIREKLYTYADNFYADWAPLVILGYLVTGVPACWPLLLTHLLLFRNGLRQSVTDLRGRWVMSAAPGAR